MLKRTSLACLICLNLLLLAAMIFAHTPPRPALAQGTGLADNYLAVAGEVQDEFDALYILDHKARTLHTFLLRRGTYDLEYGGMRLLDRDFRHNRGQP